MHSQGKTGSAEQRMQGCCSGCLPSIPSMASNKAKRLLKVIKRPGMPCFGRDKPAQLHSAGLAEPCCGRWQVPGLVAAGSGLRMPLNQHTAGLPSHTCSIIERISSIQWQARLQIEPSYKGVNLTSECIASASSYANRTLLQSGGYFITIIVASAGV